VYWKQLLLKMGGKNQNNCNWAERISLTAEIVKKECGVAPKKGKVLRCEKDGGACHRLTLARRTKFLCSSDKRAYQ
jgi:hypothetical protein